ncbi:MAG: hypothetical protein J6L84_04960, partial [Clostridiales bacterium]|nr:hypothetical protein [Clostridiales bacterium]
SAIKGIGYPVVAAIEGFRDRDGDFKNYMDFLKRVSGSQVGTRAVDVLIRSGALSEIAPNRKQCLETFERIMESFIDSKRGQIEGQMSLFDLPSAGGSEPDSAEDGPRMGNLPDIPDYDSETKLALEKEVLGIYVSGHPLDDWLPLIKRYATADSSDLAASSDDEEEASSDEGDKNIKNGDYVTVCGIARNVTQRTTKNGDLMATFKLEDLTGEIDLVAFPKTYEKAGNAIAEDEKLFVRGRYDDTDDRGAKVIAMDVVTFEDASSPGFRGFGRRGGAVYVRQTAGQTQSGSSAQSPMDSEKAAMDSRKVAEKAFKKGDSAPKATGGSIPSHGLFVRFADRKSYEGGLALLEEALKTYPGEYRCVVFTQAEKQLKVLNECVNISEDLLNSLYVMFGRDNIAVK